MPPGHTIHAPRPYHPCPPAIPSMPPCHTIHAPRPYHASPSAIPCIAPGHSMRGRAATPCFAAANSCIVSALACIAAAETCIPLYPAMHPLPTYHASPPRTSRIIAITSMPLHGPYHPSFCPHSMHRKLPPSSPFVLTFRRVPSDSHYRICTPITTFQPRLYLFFCYSQTNLW
ncbi:hypothetical protein BDZ89DRAFT_238449 [Hymenopellis radicata]|nr:hypothetical protein BDZ89DRAFT_238449 [Hymenopellis radicata]